MKIAVTGATGFIGSEVVEQLLKIPGIEVTALSRRSHEAEFGGAVRWVASDYSAGQLTEQLQGADAVIHLAAVRGTSGGIADYQVNETLTESVLLAMGEAGVKRIVFASSIAVYSDTDRIPWTEDMALTPKTLYGITKAACEHLCIYYGRQFGFSYSIVRVAQVLGTGEKKRTMMNVFMDTASEGGEIHVMGRSFAKRQFIYCRDLAAILCRLAQEVDGPGRIINAGMPAAYTNLEIAEIVNRVFENDTPIDYDDSTPERIESSEMDIHRLREELGFDPDTMEEALEDIRKRDYNRNQN